MRFARVCDERSHTGWLAGLDMGLTVIAVRVIPVSGFKPTCCGSALSGSSIGATCRLSLLACTHPWRGSASSPPPPPGRCSLARNQNPPAGCGTPHRSDGPDRCPWARSMGAAAPCRGAAGPHGVGRRAGPVWRCTLPAPPHPARPRGPRSRPWLCGWRPADLPGVAVLRAGINHPADRSTGPNADSISGQNGVRKLLRVS